MASHIDSVIASVYVFDNGMIVVCDQYGLQMPEYQGPESEELIATIIRDAPPNTRCYGITLPEWTHTGHPFESKNPLGKR